MVVPYIETPRTEAGEATRLSHVGDIDFSIEPSFHSPSKDRNDPFKQMRGARGPTGLRTPHARTALMDRRNPPAAKNEFTPLLKSAARNRMIRRDAMAAEENKGTGTPANYKGGSKFNSPALPEASSIFVDNSSSLTIEPEGIPTPPVINSSAVSTPRPMKSKSGDGVLDGGNMITLREQEAKLEQIDKENFGLKLKIHFLEDNLKRTGSEFNQATIKENTELKVDKVTLQRELKQYRKNLTRAEEDLVQYRLQLHEYAEKVRRRHADDGMREELDKLRRVAEERAAELDRLRDQLASTEHGDTENERLRDELGDMEAELREKERIIDNKEEELESLREQLQRADDGADAEVEDMQRSLDQKDQELERLRKELQITAQKLPDSDVIEELKEKLASVETERDQHAQLSYERGEKMENLERRLQLLQRQKADELEALEDRLKLAESSGSNQLQLAQQAAQDAREDLRRVRREKDDELSSMRAQLDSMAEVEDRLEDFQRQLREQGVEVKRREQDNFLLEEEVRKLRSTISQQERELKIAQGVTAERDAALEEAQSLRSMLSRRESELEVLRNTANEPDSQLEAVHNIVRERDNEVDNLQFSLQEQTAKLEALQKTADERFESLNKLRIEMATTKQTLEDDIQILEADFDAAEKEKAELQSQIKRMEEDARSKQNSQAKLESHELARKAELQSNIDRLARDLQRAQDAVEAERRKANDYFVVKEQLKIAEREAEQLQVKLSKSEERLAGCEAQLRQESRSNSKAASSELRELRELLRAATLEKEELQHRLAEVEKQMMVSAQDLRHTLKEKDRKLRAVQRESQRLANEETMQLKQDVMDKEKRHAGELRGLAKQIQYLRAKCNREEGFRASLAYSKRFFLMQIEMYNACNEADLKLIEEMGITPDESIRQKRPSLRTLAWMVMATVRMKRMQTEWAANKALHETLLRKLDQVRRQSRKTVAY